MKRYLLLVLAIVVAIPAFADGHRRGGGVYDRHDYYGGHSSHNDRAAYGVLGAIVGLSIVRDILNPPVVIYNPPINYANPCDLRPTVRDREICLDAQRKAAEQKRLYEEQAREAESARIGRESVGIPYDSGRYSTYGY